MKTSRPPGVPHTRHTTPSVETPLGQLGQRLARGSMSRREFLKRATALGLSVSAAGTILAACGGKEAETSASLPPLDTTKPDQLLLFNWSDYMPASVKKSFEKEYGIEVVETYYDGNEALLAKLQAGTRGYDVIVPDNITIHIMLMEKLIQPLHIDLIPNFANVMPKLQKPDSDPETDGNKYSVPYQWGTTGIGHRKDIVRDTIDSWTNLWNPDYKGDITMLNDYRETLGVGLFLGGYSLNSTSQKELDFATQKLIEQKPLVSAYDSVNTRRLLQTGVPLCHGWNGYVLQAYDTLGPEKLEYVLPKEAFGVWCDNMAIPTTAPSPYAGHLFMNYLFDPKVAGTVVDYTWFSSPIPAAEQYSQKIIWDFVPSEETLKRGEFFEDVGQFSTSYNEAWAKIKSS